MKFYGCTLTWRKKSSRKNQYNSSLEGSLNIHTYKGRIRLSEYHTHMHNYLFYSVSYWSIVDLWIMGKKVVIQFDSSIKCTQIDAQWYNDILKSNTSYSLLCKCGFLLVQFNTTIFGYELNFTWFNLIQFTAKRILFLFSSSSFLKCWCVYCNQIRYNQTNKGRGQCQFPFVHKS